MAVETHGVGDRRRHGLGDNVGRKVHAKLPQVKQSSKAGASQASAFTTSAGYHAVATHMPKAPTAPVAPGNPAKGG
jgi:hypothetical protein